MQQQEQDTARKIVPLTIDKAVWKNLGPARGMGGLYSHIEGFPPARSFCMCMPTRRKPSQRCLT